MAEKKKWIKPQLIVLGRGTPEERVLATCKFAALNGPGKVNCKEATGPLNCLDLNIS